MSPRVCRLFCLIGRHQWQTVEFFNGSWFIGYARCHHCPKIIELFAEQIPFDGIPPDEWFAWIRATHGFHRNSLG